MGALQDALESALDDYPSRMMLQIVTTKCQADGGKVICHVFHGADEQMRDDAQARVPRATPMIQAERSAD